ncbi:hypothetical protein DOK78_002409 [Enterococcus sp. DIV2402]|uniref:Activator of Hsp90 ATPase homologue 1/2-like C-terminal domain-containing protein n=2 Tax=Candidatus Enterococcus lowellii TaxID=2230877 RepID=A0ABZ2SRI6_9ENTE
MNELGTLHELNGRYVIRFEHFFSDKPEAIFQFVTNSNYFSQWYPFATGEMDLRIGGKISFDDGEGSQYTATITALEESYLLAFSEMDDLIRIELLEEDKGCRMVFTHTFDDVAWTVQTAIGWHNCLEVFVQLVHGQPITWPDDSSKLRKIYSEAFNREK